MATTVLKCEVVGLMRMASVGKTAALACRPAACIVSPDSTIYRDVQNSFEDRGR